MSRGNLKSLAFLALLAGACLLFGPGGAARAQESGEQEGAEPAAETPPPTKPEEAAKVLYPEEETPVAGAAAPADPGALLAAVVSRMGGAKLDTLETIGFARLSWHWGSGRFLFHEKLKTRAGLRERPLARVEDCTLEVSGKRKGELQNAAYIVNGDDLFKLVGLTVYSSINHEAAARNHYRGEVFRLLAPWIIARSGAEVKYAGLVQVKTFQPKQFVPAKAGAACGHSDYQPAEFTWHKITAAVPEEYRDACGDEVTFYLSAEDGRLLRFQSRRYSDAALGATPLETYDVVEEQEVEGLRLPRALQVSNGGSAVRNEDIRFDAISLNPAISEEELRRP